MPTHRARSTASRVLARYDAINHDLTVRFSPVLEQQLTYAHDELLSATGCTSVQAARDVVARQHRATPPHPKKSQHQRRTGKPPASTTKAPRKQHHPLPYLRPPHQHDEGASRPAAADDRGGLRWPTVHVPAALSSSRAEGW